MRIHFFNSNENREWARKVISLPPRNQTGLGTPEGYGLLRTLSLQIFEQVDWSRIYRDPITDWNKTVLVRISTAVIKHHDQKASWGAEEFFFFHCTALRSHSTTSAVTQARCDSVSPISQERKYYSSPRIGKWMNKHMGIVENSPSLTWLAHPTEYPTWNHWWVFLFCS